MILSNYFEDNPDLQFVIEQYVNWGELVPLHEEDFSDAKEYAKTKDSNYELAPTNTEEALEVYKIAFQQLGEICGKEEIELGS